MKSKIKVILKKELREMFRDKKSLAMMLVVPIMIPFLIIGISALFESTVNKEVSEYNNIGFSYDLNEVETSLAKSLNINIIKGNEDSLKKQYNEGNIDLYITKEGSKYIINKDDSDNSMYASTLVETYFKAYKEYLQNEYLASNNINSNEVLNIITFEENLIEEDNYFASYITTYAFLFIIMSITVSATYPATDATAGEKERGTLETLLTFPVKSKDIIIGKFLSVSISSMITGLISLILMVLSLYYCNHSFSIFEEIDLMMSTTSLVFSAIVIVAYSLLISGLCIAIASRAKTFKEAQSALTPITFIAFFPGMIAFMANLKTTTLYALIPFINYSLIFTDITNGVVNGTYIILMLISTILFITIVMIVIIKQYKSENILFSN